MHANKTRLIVVLATMGLLAVWTQTASGQGNHLVLDTGGEKDRQVTILDRTGKRWDVTSWKTWQRAHPKSRILDGR